MVSRRLRPGNRTFLEVASMVVTWWIVVSFAQCYDMWQQGLNVPWSDMLGEQDKPVPNGIFASLKSIKLFVCICVGYCAHS